jgi:hypothetical protein
MRPGSNAGAAILEKSLKVLKTLERKSRGVKGTMIVLSFVPPRKLNWCINNVSIFSKKYIPFLCSYKKWNILYADQFLCTICFDYTKIVFQVSISFTIHFSLNTNQAAIWNLVKKFE